MFGSLSASDFVGFAVVAQNFTNPHPRHEVSHENHAFACFGHSSMSRTQMICQLGPGAFTKKMIGGGVYCEAGAFLRVLCFDRERLLRIAPVSLKIAPRGVYRERSVYSHYYGIPGILERRALRNIYIYTARTLRQHACVSSVHQGLHPT